MRVFLSAGYPLFMYVEQEPQPLHNLYESSNITSFLWTTLGPLLGLLFWKEAPVAVCVTFLNLVLTAIHAADKSYMHA